MQLLPPSVDPEDAGKILAALRQLESVKYFQLIAESNVLEVTNANKAQTDPKLIGTAMREAFVIEQFLLSLSSEINEQGVMATFSDSTQETET